MPAKNLRQKPPLQKAFDYLYGPRATVYKPATPAATPAEGETARELIQAIRKNDLLSVERLLDAGANPQVLAATGQLPLIEAVLSGNESMIDRLIKAGADPRAANKIGETALGLVWQTARGGSQLNPNASANLTGKAYRLLDAWQIQFPATQRHHYFSETYLADPAHGLISERMDAENRPVAGGIEALDDILSPNTLGKRLQDMRTRRIPAPPGFAPIPNAKETNGMNS